MIHRTSFDAGVLAKAIQSAGGVPLRYAEIAARAVWAQYEYHASRIALDRLTEKPPGASQHGRYTVKAPCLSHPFTTDSLCAAKQKVLDNLGYPDKYGNGVLLYDSEEDHFLFDERNEL
jgi:hypothetical protein